MAEPSRGIMSRFSWDREARPMEDPSFQRAPSFPAPPRGWVQVTVSAYNLKWSRLRQWLINNFKKEKAQFNERQNELSAIDDLREINRADQRSHSAHRDRTPDPPASSTAPSIPY
ncbi:hypothetical protein CH63R_08024 [Colletotrichum higginsianum IMI 349063]|uniref:Uncharacterized protein n=1 Tax=Colletotrichum higginsianum (strain IMI 349063) TaxID=759273 RepID=A0A1B7YB56_COLHI|nr:hypothetical protein CH63R_08024 [Colletotrichum higginsianum IMI 349063]OBR09259.1 hypothetical protein CH63R_08024 [Colletotrichum higginsianum IMI 349063]